MKLNMPLVLTVLTCAALLNGCQTAPRGEMRQTHLLDQAEATIAIFKEVDPTIDRFFEMAHAYAVFPSIARGGAGIGGAHGRGVVYWENEPIGWCDVSQGTIGLQLGGQSFSQVLFFGTADAFEHFKTGNYALAANASAVAAHHGAAAAVDYERGVAVFTLPRGGLMFEAAVGGQKFSYEPME